MIHHDTLYNQPPTILQCGITEQAHGTREQSNAFSTESCWHEPPLRKWITQLAGLPRTLAAKKRNMIFPLQHGHSVDLLRIPTAPFPGSIPLHFVCPMCICVLRGAFGNIYIYPQNGATNACIQSPISEICSERSSINFHQQNSKEASTGSLSFIISSPATEEQGLIIQHFLPKSDLQHGSPTPQTSSNTPDPPNEYTREHNRLHV